MHSFHTATVHRQRRLGSVQQDLYANENTTVVIFPVLDYDLVSYFQLSYYFWWVFFKENTDIPVHHAVFFLALQCDF